MTQAYRPGGDNMDQVKRMRLRYGGTCAVCARPVAAGETAGWHRRNRTVICLDCLDPAATMPEASLPGASLDREYLRRRSDREQRVRERFPRAGGLVLALSSEPASTRAFKVGADGERVVAAKLEKLCGDEVLLLHNRRRGRRARSGDIDHIAVAPSGVYVIDAKHYRGARVRVRRSGGLFTPSREQLMIRGRDRTSLVESLNKQFVAVVEAVGTDSAPGTALFCFIDADLPLGKVRIGGVPVMTPREAARLLRRPGPLDAQARDAMWRTLARVLPPA